MGFTGGVTATQINADTIQVVASGNYITPFSTVHDYLRLKAADETIAHGYVGFEIVDRNDKEYAGERDYGPAQLPNMYSTPTSALTTTATIKMFKQKPENAHPAAPDSLTLMNPAPDDYFDAREVEQTLGAVYKPQQTGARN
jgi:hypothetical protein